jgi:hypothetical protein
MRISKNNCSYYYHDRHNQQEVLARRKAQRFMTEDFDNSPGDEEDWRKLASFGVERNQVS